MCTQLSSKYGQKRLDSGKKSITNAIKYASKRAIKKTAEATGDLIGNKVADKIASVAKNLHENFDHKIMKLMMNQKHQKKDTYHQKKDNKLLTN